MRIKRDKSVPTLEYPFSLKKTGDLVRIRQYLSPNNELKFRTAYSPLCLELFHLKKNMYASISIKSFNKQGRQKSRTNQAYEGTIEIVSKKEGYMAYYAKDKGPDNHSTYLRVDDLSIPIDLVPPMPRFIPCTKITFVSPTRIDFEFELELN